MEWDRETLIAILVEEARNPLMRGRLEDADVTVSGGNPGCGDVVQIYLKGEGDGQKIAGLKFEGSGCNVSQAAASLLLQKVVNEGLTMDDVLRLRGEDMKQFVGESALATRPRCATLALSTLKEAIRQYRRQLRAEGKWQGPIDPTQEG